MCTYLYIVQSNLDPYLEITPTVWLLMIAQYIIKKKIRYLLFYFVQGKKSIIYSISINVRIVIPIFPRRKLLFPPKVVLRHHLSFPFSSVCVFYWTLLVLSTLFLDEMPSVIKSDLYKNTDLILICQSLHKDSDKVFPVQFDKFPISTITYFTWL